MLKALESFCQNVEPEVHPQEFEQLRKKRHRGFLHVDNFYGNKLVVSLQIYAVEDPGNRKRRREVLYMVNRVPIAHSEILSPLWSPRGRQKPLDMEYGTYSVTFRWVSNCTHFREGEKSDRSNHRGL